MAGWGYWDLYDWHTMRSWYPYPLLKLLNMFVAQQDFPWSP